MQMTNIAEWFMELRTSCSEVMARLRMQGIADRDSKSGDLGIDDWPMTERQTKAACVKRIAAQPKEQAADSANPHGGGLRTE